MSANTTSQNSRITTFLMIAIVVALIAFPLIYKSDAEFAGADDAATKAIIEINPETKPWFEPVWAPPGSETQSLLFALQAAAGASVIAYFFGFKMGGRSKDSSGQRRQEPVTTQSKAPDFRG